MRATQTAPSLDVPFRHSKRADYTAGAEPARIGTTGGRAVNLGYSPKRIAVNGLVDFFCRFRQRRSQPPSHGHQFLSARGPPGWLNRRHKAEPVRPLRADAI
jgi:hypothetical protein